MGTLLGLFTPLALLSLHPIHPISTVAFLPLPTLAFLPFHPGAFFALPLLRLKAALAFFTLHLPLLLKFLGAAGKLSLNTLSLRFHLRYLQLNCLLL